LLRQDDAPDQTEGGIVIPDSAKGLGKLATGVIVSVGRGLQLPSGKYRGSELKAGDRVKYLNYAGVQITTPEGEVLLSVREKDVEAILEESDDELESAIHTA